MLIDVVLAIIHFIPFMPQYFIWHCYLVRLEAKSSIYRMFMASFY